MSSSMQWLWFPYLLVRWTSPTTWRSPPTPLTKDSRVADAEEERGVPFSFISYALLLVWSMCKFIDILIITFLFSYPVQFICIIYLCIQSFILWIVMHHLCIHLFIFVYFVAMCELGDFILILFIYPHDFIYLFATLFLIIAFLTPHFLITHHCIYLCVPMFIYSFIH